MVDGPRPYVPLLIGPAVPVSARPAKPWMGLPDAHYRCWRCGRKEEDLDVLADHEDECEGLGR